MEPIKQGLVAFLITGTVTCGIVAIVSIVNRQPVMASISATGGVVIAAGAALPR